MSISQLLVAMCADLCDADLNAIRKSRGFSVSETASRDSFASFFVSSIGVREKMQQLTAEEAITLHLLHKIGETDISFFERLYGSARQPGKPYYGTYTQQFRPTFEAVKKNLVRRGLLVTAEIKVRGETVQMERWRYALPPEFAPYLPPVLQIKQVDQPGETSDQTIRKKLLQLIGGGPAAPNDPTPIRLQNGSIYLGEQPFTSANLIDWQTRAWNNMLLVGTKPNLEEPSIAPVDAVRSLLATLSPAEWAEVSSFEPLLKIFCYPGKIPPADKILQQGWDLGLLSRLKTGGALYYRLAREQVQLDPESLLQSLPWLQISSKQDAVKVDLPSVPFSQLELLNLLANLEVAGSTLLARPSLVKVGRALPAQRQSALSRWLAENIPAFREALDTVDKRWGKMLLHENLLVARVRDLSLRIQLERELGSKIVVLSEYFVAFPVDSRPIVERVLKKSGFVTKTIKA
jgi:hypothetical protein